MLKNVKKKLSMSKMGIKTKVKIANLFSEKLKCGDEKKS